MCTIRRGSGWRGCTTGGDGVLCVWDWGAEVGDGDVRVCTADRMGRMKLLCTSAYNVYFGGKLVKGKDGVVVTDRLGSVRANGNWGAVWVLSVWGGAGDECGWAGEVRDVYAGFGGGGLCGSAVLRRGDGAVWECGSVYGEWRGGRSGELESVCVCGGRPGKLRRSQWSISLRPLRGRLPSR